MRRTQQIIEEIDNIRDLKALVAYGVGRGPDCKYLIFRDENNEERTKTFAEARDDFAGIGTFLLRQGLRNCNIAIIGENSYEWIAAYFAVVLGGNVLVPLDREMQADELAVQIITCGCRAIFYSQKCSDKIERLKAEPGMTLEFFFCLSDAMDMAAEGRKAIEDGDSEFADKEIKPDDLACIVFTSGTTGRSKGVMLTHGNLTANAVAICRSLNGKHTVGFLPLHHTFSWASMFAGFIFNEYGFLCTDYRRLVNDFQQYKPQNFAAVPLVVEKIHSTIWRTAERSGKASLLRRGMVVSRLLMRLGIDKRRVFFKDIHRHLGGNLEMIVCGGASLDPVHEREFYDMGILLLNGYGITECSPVVTVNRINNFRFGSVGLPLPCNEIKIAEPDENGVGEILVRGSNVMAGYYNDPQATAQVFDGDWFRTGDIGRIDADGFLYFIGRKKNLIVLKNGQNIAPEELEDKLARIPYVLEVLVYQEDNRIVGEFYLDETAEPHAREKIHNDVKSFNRSMPTGKNIGVVRIRDNEFPKTTTMKIKRDCGSGQREEE